MSQSGFATGRKPEAIDRQNMSNQFWWPEKLDLLPLRQHSEKSDTMGAKFDYESEFKKLDLKAIKKEIEVLMKTSQEWWP